MNKRNLSRLIVPFYFASLIYSTYIGIYETIYSLGLYSVIAIQAIGLLAFLLHLFIKKFQFQKSLRFALIVLSSLQLSFIVAIRIEKYKPTYTISIPENYSGNVYLFTTTQGLDDVQVDERGIGYIGNKGKAQWRLEKGGDDITDAFSTQRWSEIAIYENDSCILKAYDVQCLEINDSNYYPQKAAVFFNIPCLTPDEFLSYIDKGWVDESKLQMKQWYRENKRDTWHTESQQTRI